MDLFGPWARQWPEQRKPQKQRIEKTMASGSWQLCCSLLILFYRLCSIPSNKHVGAREFCDMRNCQVELRDGINLSLSAAAFSDDSCQPRWCGAEVLNEDAAWKVKTCNSMMFALKAPYIWCKVLFFCGVVCVCVRTHRGVHHRDLDLQQFSIL